MYDFKFGTKADFKQAHDLLMAEATSAEQIIVINDHVMRVDPELLTPETLPVILQTMTAAAI